ncbi:MAG TPA: phosphotransferase [Flavobacterium sp.]|nr:phosphotransferase [Flavobacterium sp.]
MKPILENNIKKILLVEKASLLNADFSDDDNKYINHEKYLWIRNTRWPFESYTLLSKVTGISAFPDKRFKYWIEVLKNKGRGFKKRIGVFFRLPFKKVSYLPINADFYFDKNNFGILLYVTQAQPKVVKFNQSDDEAFITKIKSEASSLRLANTIVHEVVKTPMLISAQSDKELYFFEQQVIFAKDLHILPENKLGEIYDQVFDFMYKLYIQEGISLVSPKNEGSIIQKAVGNYLDTIEGGKDIITKYNKLLAEDKKMFVGRIHGDLSLNNILQAKRGQIWLIDWGESSIGYLAEDLKEHKGDVLSVYTKIAAHFDIKENKLYGLNEQVFIADYIAASRLIDDNIVRENYDPYFQSKLKIRLQRMSRFIS